MEKKEKDKDNAENEPRTWRNSLKERNADLDIENDEAVGQYLDNTFSDYDRLMSDKEQLNNVLASDPAAAGILVGLSSGKDENGEPFSLIGYLIGNYYDDIKDAASSEEAVSLIAKKAEEKTKAEAEENKRRKDAEANLEKSDMALSEAVQDMNVDDKAVQDMIEWLYGDLEKGSGLIGRINRNNVTKEDWARLLYAFNRDSELETARTEGRKSLRRGEGIHRSMRNMPADTGGGGGEAQGAEPVTDPTIQRYRRMKPRFGI